MTKTVAAAVAALLAGAVAIGVRPEASQGANAAGIVLRPGLAITFNVYGGKDTSGKLLGDYQVFYRFIEVSSGGYRFSFQFTDPNRFDGTMGVSSADNRGAVRVKYYLGMRDETQSGWTALIRLSDAIFSSLKAGRPTPLEFNGPENPRTIQKVGEDDLSVLVNERSVKVLAIRAKSPDGGTFWILDDPAFPIMMQGSYGTRWTTTSVNDPGLAQRGVVESLKRSGRATTHAILFVFDSAELAGEWKPILDGVAAYLRANPGVRLEIQGHTDNFGTAAYNLALSQRRAEAVKAYLIGQGIGAVRLMPKGYGATLPVAENSMARGRALNRRVVFRVL